ncbi:MAG TPA: alpha/beta hydrolase [Dyella sp.]|uniref:alpha/beta fold hydrolase n=1 Tax=Dyella sp. TaxID=1869338 RepID=UPI002F937680
MHAPVELDVPLAHLTLRALRWGRASAPPLLALHGWLDNAASFAALAPLLADRWQVIALDLPGHGHADHLPLGVSYHFVDYVRTALAAVEALGLSRFTLLGHSMGAGIASLVAAAAPAAIERLALIEGLGPVADDGSHTLQRFRDALIEPSGKASRGLRVFRDIDQAASARAIASGLRADLARPIVERALLEITDGWHWRSDPRLNRATPLRMAESQVRALLAGIRAPTALLLATPHAPYLPPTLMAERTRCVADIAVTHLQGGHHLHVERPEAVAEWLMTASQDRSHALP